MGDPAVSTSSRNIRARQPVGRVTSTGRGGAYSRLSRMLLLTLVYYLKAELYLYGSLEWMRTPLRAVLASLSVLGGLS